MPITSTDFKYTWEQIAHGQGHLRQDRLRRHRRASTDADPKTAVVTFKPQAVRPVAVAVRRRHYGILPRHILAGQEPRQGDEGRLHWSGGPWIAKWNKGVDVTLDAEPEVLGRRSRSSTKVVFKFIADTAAEFQAFKSGEVLGDLPAAAARRGRRDQAGHAGREDGRHRRDTATSKRSG